MRSSLGKGLLLAMLVSMIGCSSSSNITAHSDAPLKAKFEEGVSILKINHNLANISERVHMFRYYVSVPTVTVPIVAQGARMRPYLSVQAQSEDPKAQMLAKTLLRIIDCPEQGIDGHQESGTISLNGKPYRAQFTVFALNYLNDRIESPAKYQEHNKPSEATP